MRGVKLAGYGVLQDSVDNLDSIGEVIPCLSVGVHTEEFPAPLTYHGADMSVGIRVGVLGIGAPELGCWV